MEAILPAYDALCRLCEASEHVCPALARQRRETFVSTFITPDQIKSLRGKKVSEFLDSLELGWKPGSQ